MKKEKESKKLTWFLDECIKQSKENWAAITVEKIESATSLGLKSTKDAIISEKLSTDFPEGSIVLTTNKHKVKGDYFLPSGSLGVVRFSKIKSQDQNKYLKKCLNKIKDETRFLGAITTIAEKEIIYRKGEKTKIIKFDNYV